MVQEERHLFGAEENGPYLCKERGLENETLIDHILSFIPQLMHPDNHSLLERDMSQGEILFMVQNVLH